ncbi:phosphotransferase [Ferrimonas sp. YFM]|uniref:phosphotransferase n=1 Tax=Ferrimonas sp. YFM TaxID=3028878 RepID=UPI002572AA5F|nr:phosphotransferase [Ferrimonas sp. YFM]BDY03089.1 hypothetical protein F0521_01300 [Ferrimonas sp. YFM]
MEINVQGNSGCALRLVRHQGQLAISKVATDSAYVARLKDQIGKQKDARNRVDLPFIHVPEILAEVEDRTEGHPPYTAVMEYLNYQDYAEFFLKSSKNKIDAFIDQIIEYIQLELRESRLETIHAQVFLKKLDEIAEKIRGSARQAVKERQLANLRREVESTTVVVPVGHTHGDLTLANMMISADGSRIGIFDFLDSYLDSPLLDVAKLRQDTQFHWSRLMTQGPLDGARYRAVMAYIDARLDRHFQQFQWYRDHYRLIQAINISRIFPYEKHAGVTEFTISTLARLGY